MNSPEPGGNVDTPRGFRDARAGGKPTAPTLTTYRSSRLPGQWRNWSLHPPPAGEPAPRSEPRPQNW